MLANPFDLVHIDIGDLFTLVHQLVIDFFLTIVDDCTRAIWVYLLHAKSDVLTVFPDFFAMVSTQYNIVIKSVHSDNARELEFHDFFRSKGIIFYHSCVETPELNFVVESKH